MMGMTSRPRLMRLWVCAFLLAAALLGQSAASALQRYRFALNQTDSLPNWAFIADQGRRLPGRGDLVAFVPPPTRYFPPGTVFAKRVAGVPGDLVEHRGRAFYINGRFVGRAKPRARDGRAIGLGPEGRIPAGRYFVYAPHPDSLDSRYDLVGWIPQSRILGRAWAVL